MWPIPFAVELAKFDRYFHVRSTIKFPLTTIVHRNHSIESNSSIESQSEERRRKKKKKKKKKKKENEADDRIVFLDRRVPATMNVTFSHYQFWSWSKVD